MLRCGGWEEQWACLYPPNSVAHAQDVSLQAVITEFLIRCAGHVFAPAIPPAVTRSAPAVSQPSYQTHAEYSVFILFWFYSGRLISELQSTLRLADVKHFKTELSINQPQLGFYLNTAECFLVAATLCWVILHTVAMLTRGRCSHCCCHCDHGTKEAALASAPPGHTVTFAPTTTTGPAEPGQLKPVLKNSGDNNHSNNNNHNHSSTSNISSSSKKVELRVNPNPNRPRPRSVAVPNPATGSNTVFRDTDLRHMVSLPVSQVRV